mgnify:CR=1 FL=1
MIWNYKEKVITNKTLTKIEQVIEIILMIISNFKNKKYIIKNKIKNQKIYMIMMN